MQHKIVGGLMGFAIGDAFGMPLEGVPQHIRGFLFPEKINKYMDPIKQSLTSFLNRGMFTDDTQILFTAIESLIQEKEYNPADLARRVIALKGKNKDTMLLRAPGWSTVYGIDRMRKKIIQQKDPGKRITYAECGKETGLGSGSACRCFALYMFYGNEYNPEQICEFNYMTHRNEETLACSYLIIKSIEYLTKHQLKNIKDSRKLLDYLLATQEVTSRQKLKEKIQEAYLQMHITESIDFLKTGIGGKCEEVVCSGLMAFMLHPLNFRNALSQSVSPGGDSDSRGAVTGLLSGFNLGFEQIDKDLLEGLENSLELLQISRELASNSRLCSASETINPRY